MRTVGINSSQNRRNKEDRHTLRRQEKERHREREDTHTHTHTDRQRERDQKDRERQERKRLPFLFHRTTEKKGIPISTLDRERDRPDTTDRKSNKCIELKENCKYT